jgi:hypothetical protein
MKPVIIRMVVDFPAPFGPRNPSTSPRSTENDTPSTARFGPNVFTKFSTLIMRFIQIPIGVGESDKPCPPACKAIYHRHITITMVPQNCQVARRGIPFQAPPQLD